MLLRKQGERMVGGALPTCHLKVTQKRKLAYNKREEKGRNKNVNALVGRIFGRMRATACKHKCEKTCKPSRITSGKTDRNTRFVSVSPKCIEGSATKFFRSTEKRGCAHYERKKTKQNKTTAVTSTIIPFD
jgi:hypothetical protein